jgi:hypothetical protein
VEWWPILWLFVALKIPLLAALWIVWWALRAEPDDAEEEHARRDEGGGPHRPRPRLPDTPRRGPHATPPPISPRRVRVHARRRKVSHR